jgi:hypothetical protein
MSQADAASGIKNVVLVSGFVDGSGWEGVYRILKKDGFQVTIVQNPTGLTRGRRPAAAGRVSVPRQGEIPRPSPPT